MSWLLSAGAALLLILTVLAIKYALAVVEEKWGTFAVNLVFLGFALVLLTVGIHQGHYAKQPESTVRVHRNNVTVTINKNGVRISDGGVD